MHAPAQTATDTAKDQAAMLAASVYDTPLKQMTTAVTWLIGALAAVGAAMIAGTQLSSIGQLSWSLNRGRLLVAGISISAAVGLILLSIGLLYSAQTPTTTDFDRLRKLANTPAKGLDLEVHRQVSGDSSLHRGKENLKALMDALDNIRTEYYKTKDRKYSCQLAAAREADETKRAAMAAEYKRYTKELEVLDTRMDEYRRAMLRVAQLDKFLRTRARYRHASRKVLVLAALAGIAFVSFAWAANPPATATAAIAQRPVAAQTLTAAAVATLKTELRTTCAAAAASGGGVPMVALSSSPAGIDLIITPTLDCPEPHRLVISPHDPLRRTGRHERLVDPSASR